ncbi:MAG: PQQ-dependent sugar dehydrogenase [Thaumarchaeota archaeon]|nr:PQQ-dependent sugar dehydrogenase [Nitrososphaerota archaeon]
MVQSTGLAFATSPTYGKYQNNLFVGDCNNGNIYRFELNQNRDGFVFNSPQLQDKVVNYGDSMDEIIFGTDFGCVSDVTNGPDGLLYIVSLTDGTIYRIVPKSMVPNTPSDISSQLFYIPYIVIPVVIASIFIYIRRTRKRTYKIEK